MPAQEERVVSNDSLQRPEYSNSHGRFFKALLYRAQAYHYLSDAAASRSVHRPLLFACLFHSGPSRGCGLWAATLKAWKTLRRRSQLQEARAVRPWVAASAQGARPTPRVPHASKSRAC